MKKSRFFAAISLLLALIAVAAVTTTAVAWFVDSGTTTANILMYSGDINLEMALYSGIDSDKDGVLDTAFDALDNPIYSEDVTEDGVLVHARSPRAQILGSMYTPVDKALGEEHVDYIAGNSVTLKVCVLNPLGSNSSANVSMCLPALGAYFFQTSGLTDAQLASLFDANTGRIMFKMQNITARVYHTLQSGDGLTSGYSTMIRSSKASDVSGSVTQIGAVNSYEKDGFYVWELSEREKFIDALLLNPGELMEIDFQLTCMQTEEIYTNYMDYWDNRITLETAAGTMSQQDAAYIRETYRKELSYFVSDDNGLYRELVFNINKFYIYGEQVND